MLSSTRLTGMRGLACLLLVAYHVVGSSTSSGLRLPPDSGWCYFVASFQFVRMPLFTILSGLLYARHRANPDGFGDFVGKKFRRLGIPLIVCTMIFWTLRGPVAPDQPGLLHALTHHYMHFWYLQALLILFMATALLELLAPPRWIFLALAVGLAALHHVHPVTADIFSLGGAFYLAPFFFFGAWVEHRPDWLAHPATRAGATAIGVSVLALQQAVMLGWSDFVLTGNHILATLCGASVFVMLAAWLPASRLLTLIGRYSYTIYLWHVTCFAPVRHAVRMIPVDSTALTFGACLASGIAGPIVIHALIERRWPLNLVLLGSGRRGGAVRRPAARQPEWAPVRT